MDLVVFHSQLMKVSIISSDCGLLAFEFLIDRVQDLVGLLLVEEGPVDGVLEGSNLHFNESVKAVFQTLDGVVEYEGTFSFFLNVLLRPRLLDLL